MITERTLRRWRIDALHARDRFSEVSGESVSVNRKGLIENSERILRLTQELLDQHLIRKPMR